MSSLAHIQAKLVAAQNCHPNAVQTLIEEALNAIDLIATEPTNEASLAADCRDAFPVPQPGSSLEAQWWAAMADPKEVPAYLRAVAAAMQEDSRKNAVLIKLLLEALSDMVSDRECLSEATVKQAASAIEATRAWLVEGAVAI